MAGLVSVAYVQRANIVDLIAVWQFEPSPAIESHIEATAMSDRGEFLFKASRPQVASSEEFNAECASLEEGTGTLGCYQPASRTILLFDVTDENLAGTEEVVAVHEMLHAAWDRMGADEHATLGPLLEAEAAARSDDAEFIERMEFYARTEPGERLNELHSIVGTEFTEISAELEEHYAEFLDDRSVVTNLHAASNAVLTSINKKVKKLVSEVEKLAASIDKDYDAYVAASDSLDADIESFNARADSGAFTTQAQFDLERNALLARGDALDADWNSISTRESRYKKKVAQLEKLDARAASLYAGLNIAPRENTP